MIINKYQQHLLGLFEQKFQSNAEKLIQKSRISFKKKGTIFNLFILFPNKDGFYLHLNQRFLTSEIKIDGFTDINFLNAKLYLQTEIRDESDALKTIELIYKIIIF
jgi:hypothetical protein